jgi:hypothetical protein
MSEAPEGRGEPIPLFLDAATVTRKPHAARPECDSDLEGNPLL